MFGALITRLRALPRRLSRGSLLLEALLAIAIFAVFLGGVGLSLLVGERSTVLAGDRSKATFVAEKALEGARNIAKRDFTLLSPGQYGVTLDATNQWQLAGTSTTTDGFVSSIVITPKDALTPHDWYQVQATVNWNFANSRVGTLSLSTYVTNWRKTGTIGNWPAMTQTSDSPIAGNLKSIVISNGYAFIGANEGDPLFVDAPATRWFSWLPEGIRTFFPNPNIIPIAHAAYAGPGLYIYNISNPAAPVRVASSFTLDASNTVGAYKMAIHGTHLYVLTSDINAELKIYNIANPTSLSSATTPIGTFDVPGNGLARAITYVQNKTVITQVQKAQKTFSFADPAMCVLRVLVPKVEATCLIDAYCDVTAGECGDCIDCQNHCVECPSNPECSPVCNNNGTCDPAENTANCPADCNCGNYECHSDENCATCPADCGTCPICNNNGVCNAGETHANCPADCFCGNAQCNAADETCATCPSDCNACPTPGDTVVIGTSDGNVYTVLVNDDGSTRSPALGSIDIDPTDGAGVGAGITDISLSPNGYAYLSTKHDTKEFLVMDLTDPKNIQFPIAAGNPEGLDEPGAYDAKTIYAFGNWVLLGRAQGSQADPTAHELKFYPTTRPVPTSLADAKVHDIAGPVLASALNDTGDFAFIGTDRQLDVVSLAPIAVGSDPTIDKAITVTVGSPASNPPVPALYYDAQTNKLYAITGDDGSGVGHLLVYTPGPG